MRITNPTLAKMTGLASVRLNMGSLCRPDGADLIVLDSAGREQPSLVRTITPAGEIELVFQVRADPGQEYHVLFGNPGAKRPKYNVRWNIGRIISDDKLPPQTRNHGLWEWTQKVKLSGSFSHTTPVTGAMTYHGTTRFKGIVPKRGQVLNQYVYLDGEQTPSQILVRLVFEDRKRANPWDWGLKRIDCNWGKHELRPQPGGHWNSLGKCPPAGKWTKLTMNLDKLIARANIPGYDSTSPTLPPLHGIEFYTDKGRAYWDRTTLAEVPAEAVPVRFVSSATSAASATAAPAFLCYAVRTLHLKSAGHPINVIRFVPSVEAGEAALWDFGDGTTSTEWSPEHLFTGSDVATVTMKLTGREGQPSTSRLLTGLDIPSRPVRFALDVVSCPRVVSAQREVLFNIRLEGTCEEALPAELVITDLDEAGSVLNRRVRRVQVLPGPDHPVNVTFTRKLSHPKLRRVRLELMLVGHKLAGTHLNVYDSADSLKAKGIRLVGDAYRDSSDRSALIRYGSAQTCLSGRQASLAGRSPDSVRRVLVLGEIPTSGKSFADRLEHSLILHPDIGQIEVSERTTPTFPAWSLPWRQVLAVADETSLPTGQAGLPTGETGVIVVALADRLLLSGVSAADAVNVIGAVAEQVRRKTDARIILVTPMPFDTHQRQAGRYAVGLKELGLLRGLGVVDLYSRASRRMKENPGRYTTLGIDEGVKSHRIPDELLDALLEMLASQIANAPKHLSSPR